jgi:uncharacterized protein YxjI
VPGLLDRDKLFVREHVGMFKAANAYDLLDPATSQVIGRAQQRVRGFFGKMMRFTSWKKYLGFRIDFVDTAAGDAVVLTVTRPFTWFRSKVAVLDGSGAQVGTFRQKLLAIGPKMFIDGADGRQIGMLRGSWTGWNIEVVDPQERPLAKVTKKWAGIGKELFTSADNYLIDVSDEVQDPNMRRLLFAAPITADMVYKEYA